MVVRDVIDTLDLVSKTIANTREIVNALKDSRAYLKRRRPSADQDLRALLVEMRSTLVGLEQVSDVVTQFRFTVDGSARDAEPARFNRMVIERQARLVELANSISDLKGSSGKMREHATALAKSRGVNYWQLFEVLGLTDPKAAKLGEQFNDLYVVDERIVELLQRLLGAARDALEDVANALGPPGVSSVENVTTAAKLLGDYAVDFQRVKAECTQLARQIEEDVAQLG